MQISTLLDQIDMGSIALPEFQRGYVWNREQVRRLMNSLYRRHPVGSLLVWVTLTESADARGDAALQPGTVQLLLDGQQRITSLYGIIRGRPPKFFEGNLRAFTDLYFNLEEEVFEFYGPVKMKDDPMWLSVTELMQAGVGQAIKQLNAIEGLDGDLDKCIDRLNAIVGIKDIDLHVEQVTGEDKTVDVVVDIFNTVNSGGTKLSKGDLALARICAQWPEARQEMRKRLDKWERAGFHFKLEWLLRCINTILTGEALFTALEDVTTESFRNGLKQAERTIDTLLNMIASRLGLDHDRVLGSRYSFPLMARHLADRGGQIADHRERDALLYWYIHTFLWGRYAGSTESVLNQDLALIEDNDGALDRIVNQLRQNRGDLRLQPSDFWGWNRGARFYPLLYMLTRVYHARDWGTGLELAQFLLGSMSSLELHHIFPKALLYKHDYSRSEVNALANFTFLTKETNLQVRDREPSEYLAEYAERQPGAIESHWIPMDRELWLPENYPEFLDARRELLANAANDFLDSLLAGTIPEQLEAPSVLERPAPVVIGGVADDDEERLIQETSEWIVEQDLPKGECNFELTDPHTQAAIANLDLAWPDGLQEGYSQPVALLLNEEEDVEDAANAAGYRYFTDVQAFREYVEREVLVLEPGTV